MPPVVSLVLPTYNGARFLRESVDSCLAQSFRDFELIVVVDGSTDDSARILAGYSDPRLIVHRKANEGLPRALNTGFQLARGRYLGWTSDDNAYEPDAIGRLVEHLERHPRAAMACGDCLLIDEHGTVRGYADQTWACFLYRAEAAEAAGPYRPEYRLVEDVDFFLRLQHFAGPIERIREPLYRYRMHPGSLSSRQLGQRHLISLKLHHDLVTRGIERLDLRALFVDRQAKCAMHRAYPAMDELLAFARQEQVPFFAELERRDRWLRSPPGWLANRMRIAARSRIDRAHNRLRLWLHAKGA